MQLQRLTTVRRLLYAVVATGSLFIAAVAQAQSGPDILFNIKGRLEPIGRKFNQVELLKRGDTQAVLIGRIAAIIAIGLGFLGLVFIILILYGGWLWMTAGGNEERVKEAQRTIRNAVLGTVVVVASYALTAFVISQLVEATQ